MFCGPSSLAVPGPLVEVVDEGARLAPRGSALSLFRTWDACLDVMTSFSFGFDAAVVVALSSWDLRRLKRPDRLDLRGCWDADFRLPLRSFIAVYHDGGVSEFLREEDGEAVVVVVVEVVLGLRESGGEGWCATLRRRSGMLSFGSNVRPDVVVGDSLRTVDVMLRAISPEG